MTQSVASKKKTRTPRRSGTRIPRVRSSNTRGNGQANKCNQSATFTAPSRGARVVTGCSADFPVGSPRLGLPSDYTEVLGTIKARIQQERLSAVMTANSAMVLLYWDIGHMILERQQHSGWGAKIIDRLAGDLRDAYPDMKGFSPRNLKYMRAFSAAWPDRAIVQGPLARITLHLGQKCPILLQ